MNHEEFISLSLSEQKRQVEKILHQRKKKAEERLTAYQLETKQEPAWNKEMHLGKLLQNHFAQWKRGSCQLEVNDWEGGIIVVPLDPRLTLAEQVAAHFKRARKLKKRAAILPQLILKTEQEIIQLDKQIQALEGIETPMALEAFCQTSKVFNFAPPRIRQDRKGLPYREFKTIRGHRILVGRSDRANEQLTFTLAKGQDLWFHAANSPGSHVILQQMKGQPLDEESIQDALHLALHFSQEGKQAEGEVVMTPCKFLRKAGRKPGQVTLSRHKTYKLVIDPQRLNRLLKMIP